MSEHRIELREFHWMMDFMNAVDVGLVILDHEYRVQFWNSFMQNHSALRPDQVVGKRIFDVVAEPGEEWLRRKVGSVMLLGARSFATWEQRPYTFRFRTYRPLTGSSEFMYQNVTFVPLTSLSGQIDHVGMIVYDVTDIAVGKAEIEAANAELERLSRTDRLTGLNNRGYWEECLVSEFARYRRTCQPCTLIMFDIDHFKRINDTHGHQAGDEVLRETAAVLRDAIRGTDVAGRYGGEEFGIILIDTATDAARYVAERLRSAVAERVVRGEGRELRCTISLGVAEACPEMSDHRAWIAAADDALYQAKEGGRNRTVVAPE